MACHQHSGRRDNDTLCCITKSDCVRQSLSIELNTKSDCVRQSLSIEQATKSDCVRQSLSIEQATKSDCVRQSLSIEQACREGKIERLTYKAAIAARTSHKKNYN